MTLLFASARLKVTELQRDIALAEREELLAQIPQVLTPTVVQNLPPYFHGIDSREQAQHWLERMLSESRFFVVESADGALIGFLFVFVDNGADAQIGYLLAEKYWGQGLATELLKGFIEVVSKTEPWVKLIGGVDQANSASANLLNKLGFVEKPNHKNSVVLFEYGLK